MKTAQYILDRKGHDVWSVHPDDSVFNAIQMMADKDVGAVVVIEDGKLAGILSERDYARNVVLKGKSSPKTKIREIMVTHVVCARLEQTAEQCMAVMTEKHVRHLPVLHEKKVVGMVSLGDVAKSIIEDREHDIEELEHYIHTA
ncbi:MAG: CBS domain-containing protein [Alphaproteobacteria bacterium]|nr:CBS domain-containing protein [Alphaproteobacteria bacterium]